MPGKSLENMHVAVLAGGHSAEREISLNSGKNVVVALKEAGYTSVELLDTAADDFMVTMATGGFDVAFIAMHGAGGEDGAMQGAMETLGIPYTASGVLASACGADKEVSKLLYAKAGIPIAPGLALEVGDEVFLTAKTSDFFRTNEWAMKSISIISSRFVASAAL